MSGVPSTSRVTSASVTPAIRPVISPSAVVAPISRPVLRRKCLASVSGLLTPRELTSSVYGALPTAGLASSASEIADETAAMSSSSGPRPSGPSPSMVTRRTERLPMGVTSSLSSSSPCSARIGSMTAASCDSCISLAPYPVVRLIVRT